MNINDTVPLKAAEPINTVSENNETPKFITTEEEIEGAQIVKAILREIVPSSRIAFRDTQSYFSILLDDNNRKPICRLHFNTSNKYIELFNNGKDNGEKILISSLDELYNFRKELHLTIGNYE